MSLWLTLLMLTAAEERRPTSVTFDAPSGCPARERFEQELVFRTTRVQLVDEGPEATAHIEVKLAQVARRFTGRLTVRTADGKSVTKELKGPKCESVTAALSLAAALVLDPEGANTAPLPASLPAVVVEPAPQPPPVEPLPAVVIVEPPPPVPVEPPVPKVTEPGEAPRPRGSAVSAGVFALGVMSTTISGAPDFGAGVGGELLLAPGESSPVRVVTRLGLTLTSGRTVTSSAGSAAYPLGVGGVLGVGAAVKLGVVRPELGVSAQLTSLSISGLGTERVTLSLGGWLVALEGMLAVTAVREVYRVDPDGLVFQVPPLGAVAQLQLGRAFP